MLKEVILEIGDKYHLQDHPLEVIEFFKVAYEQVPEEFRESALIKVDLEEGYDGWPTCILYMRYQRPFTQEELGKLAEDEEAVRSRELALLAELKRKYE